VKYNFDLEIDRRGTHSFKWELLPTGDNWADRAATDRFYGENRILPMWVADMDFACPQPVIEVLEARARHGIFGYTYKTASYYKAVVNWLKKRHGWRVSAGWICSTPGVVPALNMLVRTFVGPGEKVLLQPPVYYPFYSAIKNNGVEIVTNPLVLENGRYCMDFADLAKKAADPAVKMIIVSNPHNPVGRVWSREELIHLGEICLQHNVLVVADEIHGDLIYSGHVFTPFASLNEDFAQNSITCTAPSKTFNLAGLHTSNLIIPNNALRATFEKTIESNGLGGVNAFGVAAMEAAYNHGEEWLEQVLVYIEENLHFMEDFIAAHIPQITVIKPEGTYLVWLDCRGLGLDKTALKQLMLNQAGVFLDEGYIFGPQGEGFERINIACPRSILAEALHRIKTVVETL
jgi:cystathionine beta-lyase